QGFKPPNQYKAHSLMMLANHDVPTLVAWWRGLDLQLRRKLNLLTTDAALREALAQRRHEKQQLLARLIEQGLLPGDGMCESGWCESGWCENDWFERDRLDIDKLLLAWMTLGASGNSALFSVQWSDVLADLEALNVPGTWQEYPNWQRRLPLGLRDALASPAITARLQCISAARQRPRAPGPA
ncbi:MAG: 4-alpha-glucanotransferase, partial [Shewanella sp.]